MAKRKKTIVSRVRGRSFDSISIQTDIRDSTPPLLHTIIPMMVQAKFSAKHALVLSAREVGKGRKAVGRAAAARRATEGKIDCFVQKLDLFISFAYLNVNSYLFFSLTYTGIIHLNIVSF